MPYTYRYIQEEAPSPLVYTPSEAWPEGPAERTQGFPQFSRVSHPLSINISPTKSSKSKDLHPDPQYFTQQMIKNQDFH